MTPGTHPAHEANRSQAPFAPVAPVFRAALLLGAGGGFLAFWCAHCDQYDRGSTGKLVVRPGPGARQSSALRVGRAVCCRGVAALFTTPAWSTIGCHLAGALDRLGAGRVTLRARPRATMAGGDWPAFRKNRPGGQWHAGVSGAVWRRSPAWPDVLPWTGTGKASSIWSYPSADRLRVCRPGRLWGGQPGESVADSGRNGLRDGR